MEHKTLSGDVLFGGFLVVVGLSALFLLRELPVGTPMRMGPAFFPTALAALLIIVGVANIAASLRTDDPVFAQWNVRTVFFVTAAIAFFAAVIESLGLPLAVVGVVLIGGAANHETRWREAIPLAVGLATACTFLFAKVLGLPFRLWPWFM